MMFQTKLLVAFLGPFAMNTVFFRSMQMTGHYRLPRISSTRIDCFPYFVTDDPYLNYLARFVQSGCQVGIAEAGLMREIEGSPPEHLRQG